MSTVLRTLCNNFKNISENRSAVSLIDYAQQVLIEFNCVSKLIASD
jgi:hypothetical protein